MPVFNEFSESIPFAPYFGYIHLLVTAITCIGVLGFVTNFTILNKRVWKFWLIIMVFYFLYFILYKFTFQFMIFGAINPLLLSRWNWLYGWIFLICDLVLIIAVYRYGFKSNKT